jgi:hypothetical protein
VEGIALSAWLYVVIQMPLGQSKKLLKPGVTTKNSAPTYRPPIR